jgi:endo-1,4-beta-xylanase
MFRHLPLAALALPLLASSAWAQTTLKEAAAAVGLNFGIATNSNQVNTATSAYATAAKGQFNMVVCENEMKFESTERTIGQFTYTGGDNVYKFAEANQMKMRGHTFVWHSQSGSAQNAIRDRASGLKIMKDHIEAVGGHFKEKIFEWDVLNEITDDGNGNKLRTGSSRPASFWQANIGDDFADSALAFSRRVIGTNGHLYYNDYGADGVNGKSTAIFNLAKKWQTNKVPLDGIGLQAHLSSGLNQKSISDNIKRYGEIGLRISLTEIDIKNAKTADWVNLMNACLENFNCVSFVTWGMADGNSWIGSDCGCLLYSGSGNSAQPKPEFINALIDAMKKADPAIVAKRKAFAAIPPGSLGTSGVGVLQRPVARRGGKNLSILASTPVFSTVSGAVVDPLGRAKSVSPARIDRLEILPR